MNPWTALVIGLVLGWLIEFGIDWFYWRRKSTREQEIEELQSRIAAAEARAAELEAGVIVTAEEVSPAPTGIDYEGGVVWDEEPAEDSEISAGEILAAEEIIAAEDDYEAVAEWDLPAEEIAAAGAAAAVVAGAGDDTTGEELEKEPADELDEEIAAAFAGQSETGLADEQLGAEFDSAGEIAAAGAVAAGVAAAVAAGAGDDTTPEELAQAPADERDKEIAAAGAAAAVVAGAGDETSVEELEPDDSEAVFVEDFIVVPETEAETEDLSAMKVTGAAALTRDLSYIEGIGPVYAGKLKEAGVATPQALLEKGATPKGRKELAEQTGISGHLILKWVNHVDLFRIKGLGSEFADLLEASGVDTVPELAQRNPQNLYQKVLAVNEEKRLVRQTPSQAKIEDFVSQAKQLPRVITY